MVSFEKFKEQKFESREKTPFEADLRVDFIRHGEPVYLEEEIKKGKPEGMLTAEAKEKVREQIKELASGIDKEKELAVIWSSPRKRAQQTAEAIKEVFEENGILVIEKGGSGEKLRIQKSLRDIDMNAEAMLGDKRPLDMQSWLEGKYPKGVETPEDFKKRTMRVIAYLERIARTIHLPEGKKFHFICVGHEETVGDLLETAYGTNVRKSFSPTFGEEVRLDITKSERGKDAILDLSYKGYPKTKLGFNKEKREIYSKDNEEKD